jgi:hypothetical protein
VYQLFVDIEKVCDSVTREILYNIFFEFDISMKLFKIIKTCLNETYSFSKFRISKNLVGAFHTQNGLIDFLWPFLFKFVL